jgi:hypothetical protein
MTTDKERFAIISKTGTRHWTDTSPVNGSYDRHPGRVFAICNFGIWPGEMLDEATRDCEFCQQELHRWELEEQELRRQKPETVPPAAEAA